MIWLLNDVIDERAIKTLSHNWVDDRFHCGSDRNPNLTNKRSFALDYEDANHDMMCQLLYDQIKPKIASDFVIKCVGQPYFSWYKPGCFYDKHLDAFPITGLCPHFSFTVFLNDPEEYEGGELTITVGNTERSFKPKAGSMVLYSTGLWHQVNKVTGGVGRKVAIGWAESFIANSAMRQHVIDLKHAINEIADDIPEESLKKLESVRVNIIREYATL